MYKSKKQQSKKKKTKNKRECVERVYGDNGETIKNIGTFWISS